MAIFGSILYNVIYLFFFSGRNNGLLIELTLWPLGQFPMFYGLVAGVFLWIAEDGKILQCGAKWADSLEVNR